MNNGMANPTANTSVKVSNSPSYWQFLIEGRIFSVKQVGDCVHRSAAYKQALSMWKEGI